MTPDLEKIFGCFLANGSFRSGFSFESDSISDTSVSILPKMKMTITSSSGLIPMY
ncbi:MAG: hypothetical protein U5L72_11590 [Bacteroidales bacterium]|nr:hypothetical protein [Bacteroidales bacterium]